MTVPITGKIAGSALACYMGGWSSLYTLNPPPIPSELFRYEKRLCMNGANMNRSSETDWTRVDALTDETIDTSDIPPLTAPYFARAVLRTPEGAVRITVQIDHDILAWFQAQGEECAPQINAALRRYMEAHAAPPQKKAG